MPAGRRRQPDLLKALKGNPGKRKLALDATGKAGTVSVPLVPMPDFLTEEREKIIFRRVVDDYLHRRIARLSDITAYGRWAHYVALWIGCKEKMAAANGQTFYQIISNHGKRFARSPVFKDMLDLERALQSLEDRLGLNPVARQNIIRGLSTMPAALGPLFGDEPAQPDTPASEHAPSTPPEEEHPPSPVGIGRLN